jgi:hypothetical protein
MSWEQLRDIERERREEANRERVDEPVACPNDGEPLVRGPNGELHCTFDGWQYPRDINPLL